MTAATKILIQELCRAAKMMIAAVEKWAKSYD